MSSKRYPPELRERAVRMVLEHRGEYASEPAAINAIASKMAAIPIHSASGCASMKAIHDMLLPAIP